MSGVWAQDTYISKSLRHLCHPDLPRPACPATPRPARPAPPHNKQDFQESWELMFDTVDTLYDCIRIATGVLSTLRIDAGKMRAGLSADMLATDLAEYLVRKGGWCGGRGGGGGGVQLWLPLRY